MCIKYCEENNIEPREHALCYDKFFPDWLVDKTVPEIKQYIVKRMQQISRRYADKIPTIEVTNEMFWDKGKTPVYADPDFMVFCYEQAAKYFPKNELCINEWSGDIWNKNPLPWNNYYLIIENLLLKGARVDAIGMQYHMFYNKDDYFKSTRRVYNLRHLIQVMDNFARLKKPFQITEITIPAFTEESADEQAQADIIEQLYSTWFSYPNVEQIIYWNMVDGYAYGTRPGDMNAGENVYRGGLLRFDLSEKPAFQRIKHLVKDVWTTNEQLETKGGAASFRGFYGEYEVEADGKKCIVSSTRTVRNMRKKALVTGSTQGIGKEIAKKLVQDGYSVTVHCRRDIEKAENIRREIGAANAVTADLSKWQETQSLFSKTGASGRAHSQCERSAQAKLAGYRRTEHARAAGDKRSLDAGAHAGVLSSDDEEGSRGA